MSTRLSAPTAPQSRGAAPARAWAPGAVQAPARHFYARAQSQGDVRCRAASVDVETETTASPVAPAAARATAFAPRAAEVIDEVEVEVTGELPAWLCGAYVRNGPGVMEGMQHMFSGYGMLLKMRFEDGKVYASQRMLQTGSYKAYQETGEMKFSEFGTAIPMWKEALNIFGSIAGLWEGFTDNAGVSVQPIPGTDGKELLAMTEVNKGQYRVDADTLATKAQVTYDDDLGYIDVTTAHPTILPDGTALNILQDMPGGKYLLAKFPFGGNKREVIATIPRAPELAGNSWIHDFPVTENYAIIPETPITYNLAAFLDLSADYIVFDWNPEAGTKFHVVPLDGSSAVKTFVAPPFFTFHYINAFETTNADTGAPEIVIDIPWYSDPEFINGLKMDRINGKTTPVRDIEKGTLQRVTLPMDGSSDRVRVEDLCPDHESFGNSLELPRISQQYKGKPYRYAYADCATPPTIVYNSVAKFDTEDGVVAGKFHVPGCIIGEPYFVPRPGAEAEDDGVVLAAMTKADGTSHMVVLDGQTFEEVALLSMPHKVPYGFHATFVASEGASV